MWRDYMCVYRYAYIHIHIYIVYNKINMDDRKEMIHFKNTQHKNAIIMAVPSEYTSCPQGPLIFLYV